MPIHHKQPICIFASGTGSNTKKIIEYSLQHNASFKVALVVSSHPQAKVLQVAESFSIPAIVLNKPDFTGKASYIDVLKNLHISYVVLAGFLWKVPHSLLQHFPEKIVNIHPALLPKYGGKGMYGQFVHQAVIENKEKESGITIHEVDEVYDNGKIIFQAKAVVEQNDSPTDLANKIHALEHQHFPTVIDNWIQQKTKQNS